jgi:signal transduction histidine kinase
VLARLSIIQKTILLVVSPLLAVALLTWTIVSDTQREIAALRDGHAATAMKAALSILRVHHGLAVSGALSHEEARTRALAIIADYRYDAGDGYIAVVGDDMVIRSSAIPKLIGSDLTNFRTPDGRITGPKIIELGRMGDFQLERYAFENPLTGAVEKKVSAFARFDPWGFTLIAGVYDQRIDAAMEAVSAKAALSAAAILWIMVVSALLVGRSIAQPISALTAAMRRIAAGALDTPIPHAGDPNEIGAAARALAVFRDNDRALAETKAQLEQALSTERELAAQQRHFVSLVSHEIRTPLSIIDAQARRLKLRRHRLSETQVDESLDACRAAVGRLVRLMEQTLAASKAEAGTLTLEPEPVALAELVAEIVAERRALDEAAAFACDLAALPPSLSGDPQLLRLILENLVCNAIKYGGEAPQVRVRGWVDGAFACIAVSDTGVGIAAEDLGRIGERYFRAGSAKGLRGTGIGLNTSMLVARLHGGSIAVDSVLGRGSTFTLRLPLAAPEAAVAAA